MPRLEATTPTTSVRSPRISEPRTTRFTLASAESGAAHNRLIFLGFAAVVLLLILRAIVGVVDHDEDQYLAGAVLAGDALMFRDFMHLQTPLQALLFAPVAAIFDGHVYLALRVANALVGAGLLGAVFFAQRLGGASSPAAFAATLLLFFCQSFQHSASVVRNDVVPAFFSALAIAAAVAAIGSARRAPPLWALAGLLFGLATSSKVSHAFLAVGAGAYLLWLALRGQADRRRWLALAAFGAGGIAGLLPTLYYLAAAPGAFLWGVVEYGARAPFDWYRANGLGELLTLRAKVFGSLDALSQGPALLALAAVAVLTLRLRRREPPIPLLDVLLIAGLIGALLPTPTWTYYFMTLLPPLFIRLGLSLDGWAQLGRGWRLATLTALAISLVLAVDWRTRAALATPLDDTPIGRTHAAGRWIGATLRGLDAQGTIATLAPRVALDSGFPIDPRFATGVFVYRSGDLLPPADHDRFNTVGPASLAASLDRRPPAAILVGYEGGTDRFDIRPDDGLRAYARSRGYLPMRGPDARVELYVNPKRLG